MNLQGGRLPVDDGDPALVVHGVVARDALSGELEDGEVALRLEPLAEVLQQGTATEVSSQWFKCSALPGAPRGALSGGARYYECGEAGRSNGRAHLGHVEAGHDLDVGARAEEGHLGPAGRRQQQDGQGQGQAREGATHGGEAGRGGARKIKHSGKFGAASRVTGTACQAGIRQVGFPRTAQFPVPEVDPVPV